MFQNVSFSLLKSDQCGQNLNQFIESLNKFMEILKHQQIYGDFKALTNLKIYSTRPI